jgi:uncharacterized protein YceK
MTRFASSLLITIAVGVLTAGCGSTTSSGGGAAGKPTFSDAQRIAEQQMKGTKCKFQVDDRSEKGLEDKSLECLTRNAGQPKLYTLFQYENHTDGDTSFAGFVTVDHYFTNGTIKIDASAASEPGQPTLDPMQFSQALKSACSCGAIRTPSQ